MSTTLAAKASLHLEQLMHMAQQSDESLAMAMSSQFGRGYSKSNINEMRRGLKPLSLKNIEEYADYFGVPTSTFTGDDWPDVLRYIADNLPWWCAPRDLNPEPAVPNDYLVAA